MAEAEAKLARTRAEENERIAKIQGRQAEGLRLAMLSEQERYNKNKEASLWLAFLSLQLLPIDTLGTATKAFGEAVRDSFEATIFKTEEQISLLESLSDSTYLVGLQNGQILYISPEKTKALEVPSGQYLVALAESSKRFALYGKDSLIHLYNWNGAHLVTITAHEQKITYATFSPDCQKLLTCSRDNTAAIWTKEGSFIARLNKHKGNIYNGSFSSNNQYILLRSSDGTASWWDTQGNFLTLIGKNEIYIYDATFSPLANQVLTVSANKRATWWDSTGINIYQIQHSAPVKRVFLSATGHRIITLDAVGKAILWDQLGNYIQTIGDSCITSISFNPKNSEILVGSKNGKVILLGKQGNLQKKLIEYENAIIATTFSENGYYSISTSITGTCLIWDSSGKFIMNLSLDDHPFIPARFSPNGHSVTIVRNNLTAIVTYPLPTYIYQQMSFQQIISDPKFQQLKQRYNIQFLEEINKGF